MSRVKIVTFVPPESADIVRDALGSSGAGNIGEYSFCSFSARGYGRFKPSENTRPYSGVQAKINAVDEERIEVVCDRDLAKLAIETIRRAHPYEVAVLDIYPLIDEGDL